MGKETFPPPGWQTLREIDAATGQTKGVSFRAFRALAEAETSPRHWQEGPDYRLVRPHQDPSAFALLAPRLYPGTQTAILVSPALGSAIAALAPHSR